MERLTLFRAFQGKKDIGYDDERIKAEAFIMHAFEVIGMEPPRNV